MPARYFADALHIAAAVLGDADVLVSWNFKHLVRRSARLLVNYINTKQRCRTIEILTPKFHLVGNAAFQDLVDPDESAD